MKFADHCGACQFLFLVPACLQGSASAFLKYSKLVEALRSDGKTDEWDKRAGIPAWWGLAGNSDWDYLVGQWFPGLEHFSQCKDSDQNLDSSEHSLNHNTGKEASAIMR